MKDELPELRASDAERERTADQLRRAAGEGRLTMEELEERLHAAYAARTHRELDGLTADIVVRDPAAPGRRMPVREGEDGAHWLVSVMSGRERKGRWRVGRRCRVVNVMGGSDLDLNDAELAGEQVELMVFSLMGGAEIRVPEGLNVEVSEFAFMGGNDVRLGNELPDPGGPLLRLRLVSIMGGSDVKRGRKVSRRERARQRELERRRGL
jgi:Domain of unknown function (DUF1707)/Cell wall-active antibiotics response 4TMS YvqF